MIARLEVWLMAGHGAELVYLELYRHGWRLRSVATGRFVAWRGRRIQAAEWEQRSPGKRRRRATRLAEGELRRWAAAEALRCLQLMAGH